MKNVTYIDASAGSGKTYTLTSILAELIAEGKVRPDQVILTTFTTKAADEFREKSKDFLFKKGLFEEAAMLDHALIGTIHSVANSLISKYWFHLGLAPDMEVMAEEDKDFYISQSLSDLPKDEELATIHKFARTFGLERTFDKQAKRYTTGYDKWKADLTRIIELATNYEITDFSKSRERSLQFIRQFVKGGFSLGIDSKLLKTAIAEHRKANEAQKPTTARDNRLIELSRLSRMTSEGSNIAMLKDLAKVLTTPKKTGPTATLLRDKLQMLWHSEEVFNEQKEYVNLMFTLAGRWQKGFVDFKREKNLLDYNDMERYMMRLIETPELAEEIAAGYRYLFVDEFQDCSPIQVKIFDRLSTFMEHSYWVGDYKQAIYGFRGSDITLTKAIVDRVATGADGCETTTLDTSYRSLPDIVEVCNDTFEKTFSGTLNAQHVRLKQHRKNSEQVSSLRFWDVSQPGTLAPQIAALIQEGVAPADIAVLGRSNEGVDTIAESLTSLGIPVCRSNMPVSASRSSLLVPALLSIVESPRNTLAKAQVAYLTVKDYGLKRLIDDKLAFNADETTSDYDFLNDAPLVASVLRMRDRLRQQPLTAMVQTLIIELDLYNVVKQWGNPEFDAACLDTFVRTAAAYDQHCVKMDMASSITGFLSYVTTLNPLCAGDADGVQLMTYHASKGLQWKYVILTSLYDNPDKVNLSVKRNMFGVQTVYTQQPDAATPFPEVIIHFAPFIYGTANTFAPTDIQATIENGEQFQQAHRSMLDECNRLLYVGMTRAKDVLILAIEKPENKKPLQWFVDIGLTEAGKQKRMETSWDLLGVGHNFSNCTLSQTEIDAALGDYDYRPADSDTRKKRIPYSGEPCEAPPRDVAPSSVKGTAEVKSHVDFGRRIPLASLGDRTMDEVGDCIHQIYCALDSQTDAEAYIDGLIQSYGMRGILTSPAEIALAWQRLTDWLTEQHGAPVKVFHELTFQHLRDGHVYNGSIDLVWRTPKGDILVDYKTCPMGKTAILDPGSKHYAGNYAGQLGCYNAALSAAGESVLRRYLFYPVSGLIVEL